jgi:hypothetical protein
MKWIRYGKERNLLNLNQCLRIYKSDQGIHKDGPLLYSVIADSPNTSKIIISRDLPEIAADNLLRFLNEHLSNDDTSVITVLGG